MKKRVLYILFMRLLSAVFLCLCSYNYMNAQPLWEGLSVDKFYRENNGLSQGQNTLIYKKDTMKIYIEPIPYHLIMGIKRVHFQKGEYVINLKKCILGDSLKIKNFPCDCLNYRREEE